MADAVVTKYQPSMTEWFAALGEAAEAEVFRDEDNRKVERLEQLFLFAGIPYERPLKLPARALTNQTQEFKAILKERGNKLCAIRLVPVRSGIPKLRNRGLPLKECYEEWYLKQKIDPDDYVAFICPHSETLLWSATLVVNSDLIFGEAIRGLHSQLTHGDTTSELYQFRYDYKTWQWSRRDSEAERAVESMIKLIHVPSTTIQQALRERLETEFSNNYLNGYFEFTIWPDGTLYVIDYNRLLPRYIATPPPLQSADVAAAQVAGTPAFAGKVKGKVVIVTETNIASVVFPEGAVLVCDNTDVRYLPFMQRAAAIVTNRGGILSHAAIIARELKIPCIVGTTNATEALQVGTTVEVDATTGTVRFAH